MSDWTPENAAEWKRMLETETGQKAIAKLKDDCRVPGAVAITPGLDLKEIAAQSYAHAQGQSDVFDKIAALMPPPPRAKPLPPQFQKEPPPKPE